MQKKVPATTETVLETKSAPVYDGVMKRVFVRPVQDIKVRQPDGQHLPESGKEVIWNTYWQRCLNAGDIFISDKDGVK